MIFPFPSSPLPVPIACLEFAFLGVSHLNCQHFHPFESTVYFGMPSYSGTQSII